MLSKSLLRTSTAPLVVPRSRRSHDLRGLTSIPAGKMTPLAVIPLLREDTLERTMVRFSLEMSETVEMLINSVLVNFKAYLVTPLCFDRFHGLDDLDRSFNSVANPDTGLVTPYFTTAAEPAPGVNKIHYHMGKHAKEGDVVNTAYTETYNAIWNFRAKNRSPDIALRAMTDTTLAPAFWQHEQFSHIVPDFDQAAIDGEVPLNIVAGKLPVKSEPNTAIKLAWPETTKANLGQMNRQSGGTNLIMSGAGPGTNAGIALQDASGIFAELQENGITVSLSNIEMARKTQTFAEIRQRYAGHDDEYIIDMLMDGLSVADQAYSQPILLAERSTVFGMSKRYSSDADALTESVVNGITAIDMTIRTPRVPMGGVIMIVCEITPEQLFERQMDPYLYVGGVADLPRYIPDTLDPEKVEVVQNRYVDVSHSAPTGVFGYAPLNHKWDHQCPGIGGKFFRPTVNTSFDEARLRLWSVETVDPTLSADFYLCNNMHLKPFVVQNQDPFEVVWRGSSAITGNTVFGRRLIESTGDWDEVLERVDQDRIDKPAAVEAAAPAK